MLEESIFDYKTTLPHSQLAHRGVEFWGLGWIFFCGGINTGLINNLFLLLQLKLESSQDDISYAVTMSCNSEMMPKATIFLTRLQLQL